MRCRVLVVPSLLRGLPWQAPICCRACRSVPRPYRDCNDFKTQKAQRWFKRHGGSKSYDPWNLDADNDGKACESLP